MSGLARQRGFTLLELMIAIGIFALLGVGTYRMLAAVTQADEATRAHERALRDLSRAFATFDRDLLQAMPRAVRDSYGEERPALLGELGASDGKAAVEFTRAGWRNPLGLARAGLQRVRWRLAGESLERLYWTVLDQAVDSQPRVQKVLDGVTSLELRYLDGKGQWQGQWPPPQDATAGAASLPQAVELKLEHVRYGELVRLYRLPEAAGNEPEPGAGKAPTGKNEPVADKKADKS